MTLCVILCVLFGLVMPSLGNWVCTTSWLKVYARKGSVSVIPFSVTVNSSAETAETVKVLKVNQILAVVLYLNPPQKRIYVAGYDLVGNIVSGELNLRIENVTAQHANSYVVIYGLDQNNAIRCATLYVLGVPSPPAISADKIPSVGESVTFTCSSTSTTIPSNHSLSLKYDWTVNDVVNPSDPRYSYSASRNTLALSNVTKDDAGKRLTCTATENVTDGYTSIRSEVLTIAVHYGPENVTFVPPSTRYLKEENTELPQITCGADCNPACTFEWTKEASQVSDNKTLQLGNLEASEAGIYRCTATRPGSAASQHLELAVNVVYGPYQASTTLSPGQTEYTINEKEVQQDITCNANCYPYCNYTWTKQSGGSTSVVSKTAVLSLGRVVRTDAAKYVCSAVNLHKQVNVNTSKEVQIKVNYGPDKPCDNVSSVQIFREGDNSSIRCSSECNPGCLYIWSNSSSILSRSETLTLESVNRHQAGIYTFRAENQAYTNSAQKMFNVTIMYAPVVSIELSTPDHPENTTLTLYCKGEGVPANYTYTGLTQTVGEVEIPNPNTAFQGTDTNSSIHFPSLQLQDTGNYTCRMNNGILDTHGTLEQTKSVELLVEVRPHIFVTDLRYTGAQGKSTTVQIPFYCYPPVQSATFFRYDGTQITNGTKYRTSLMHSGVQSTFYSQGVTLNGYQIVWDIKDLTEEDFVNYTLTIENSRGKTSELVHIVAESIPSIPKSFFLASQGFFLIWEKNFNGGHPQSFIVEFSIDGREDWHSLSNISEDDKEHQVNSTFYEVKIEGLDPGKYTARLIARNFIGETAPLYLNDTFSIPSEENKLDKETQIVAAAAGGTVSAVIVFITVVVGVLIWRRRAGEKGKETSKLQLNKHATDVHGNDSDDDDVEVENPMYVSAGPKKQLDDNVYAKPHKKQKPDKSSDVYADVNKQKASDKKKKEKQVKSKPAPEGDIYENAPKTSGDANTHRNAVFENTPYETTEISANAKKNSKSDDLMYADLAFSKTPKGKKLVIHGVDDRTPYAQVDFSRHAEPLPESDTEEQEQTPKK